MGTCKVIELGAVSGETRGLRGTLENFIQPTTGVHPG